MREDKSADAEVDDVPANSDALQQFPSFWKRWGPSLTVLVAITGALVTAGIFLLRQVDALDVATKSVEQLRVDVRNLQEHRLPELQEQYDALTESLSVIGEWLDPEGQAKLEELLEGTQDTRQILDEMSKDLETLESKARSLPTLEERSDQLLSSQQEIKTVHREDFAELRTDIKDLLANISKLEALAEILKPIISQEVAFGRIDRETLQKFYTDEEIEQFVKDATELVESGELPGGGSGGGSSYRLGYLDGASLNCVGDGANCFHMSVFLPRLRKGSSQEEVIIGLYSGPEAQKIARELRIGNAEEIRLAASSYDGSLCAWAYSFANAHL